MPRGTRRFVTVLFTDIVGSTDIVAEIGDRGWRELVRQHHAIVRAELKRFEGREMDTAGDGFFATFDSPGDAIRCACAISDRVREVGLEIRAGLHGGEVEFEAGKASGIAVITAARVMTVGGPGDVLVSSSLRDAVAGSTLGFADRGVHGLKGIEGEWRLFAVAELDGVKRPMPLDPAEGVQRRTALMPVADEFTSWRRRVLVGILILIPAAIVALVVARGGGPSGTTRPEVDASRKSEGRLIAGAVVELDPMTGTVRMTVTGLPGGNPEGFSEEELAVGEGSVWLFRERSLIKIDPADGSYLASPTLTGDPEGIAVYARSVWLARQSAGGRGGSEITDFSAATGKLERVIRTAEAFRAPQAVAAAFGSVWIGYGDGTLLRMDPATERQTPIPVGSLISDVTVGDHSIWTGDDFEGVVSGIDPARNEVMRQIHLTTGVDRMAVGEGFVWVLDASAGVVVPISVSDLELSQVIAVGPDAGDIAVGLGAVWVARGTSVLRIDPLTHRVDREISLEGDPILRVAVDTEAGSLWLDIGH